MIEPLLRVEGLVKHFPVEAGVLARLFGRRPASVQAVNHVSLQSRAVRHWPDRRERLRQDDARP